MGADRQADADLAGAFGDGDEHDVHDADAADNEGHAGDDAEEESHGIGGGGGSLGQLDLVAHSEVRLAAAATLGEQVGDVLLDLVHFFGSGGLDEDGVEIGAFADALHAARVGHDHNVVLILAEEVVSFHLQDAEDFEGNIANAEGLPDGFAVREKLVHDGLSDDADLADAAHVLLGEHGALGKIPGADKQVVGTFAVDRSVPVQAVGENLGAVANLGADRDHVRDFTGDRVGVIGAEGAGAAAAAPESTGGEVAGKHADDILTEAGDLGLDLGLGAVADADDGDDGGDADDDAKAGED